MFSKTIPFQLVVMSLFISILYLAAPVYAEGDDYLEITLLRTVNLPHQHPEAILTAFGDIRNLHIDVTSNGSPVKSVRLADIQAGNSKSISWQMVPGSYAVRVTVTGQTDRGQVHKEVDQQIQVIEPLVVRFQHKDVDLDKRALGFETSNPVQLAEITMYDQEGRIIFMGDYEFDTQKGSQLRREIDWPELPQEPEHISVRVFGASDAWTDFEWTPLEVEIPHNDVLFDAGSSAIAKSEYGKLIDTYTQLVDQVRENQGIRNLRLYVLAQIPKVDNLTQKRVESIAAFFRNKGLAVPIVAQGIPQEEIQATAPSEIKMQYILSTRTPIVAE